MELTDLQSNNVVLVMHQFPDADALASAYIIKELLRKRYPLVKIRIIIEGKKQLPVPGLNDLDFEGCTLIDNKYFLENPPATGGSVYLIDHSDPTFSLLKDGKAPCIKEIKLVDHHIYYGTCPKDTKLFLDDTAGSATQVLYEYLEKNEYDIPKGIAMAAYIGFFSDTMKCKFPLFEREFRFINRLLDKGIDLKTSNQYARAEHLTRSKAIGECMFLHTNKAKNSETATIILPHNKVEKFWKQYVTINCILYEVLRKPYIDHALIRYETYPNFGCVRVQTTDHGLVGKGKENSPGRPNYHVWKGMNETQAKTLVKNLRQRLDRGDKEKRPKHTGDELITTKIPEVKSTKEEKLMDAVFNGPV